MNSNEIKYDLRSSHDSDGYKNLQLACMILNSKIDYGIRKYVVEDCWRDFDAGIMATTIIVKYRTGRYQITPNQCELIREADTAIDFLKAVMELAESENKMVMEELNILTMQPNRLKTKCCVDMNEWIHERNPDTVHKHLILATGCDFGHTL